MDSKISKKETLINLIKNNKEYFSCPFCGSSVKLNDNSLICSNKHTFNINKKGYLYMNTSSKLQTSDLYNDSLFRARRNVIISGLYDEIHTEIINIINKYNNTAISIIDIGSGEASHLQKISKLKNFDFKFALDLSKPGIALASDYVCDGIISSISDVEKLPLKSNSIDVVLDFLSPMSLKECFRVLKENGLIIKVMPTSNYLKEVRDLLSIKSYDNENQVEANIVSKYTPIYKTTIEYKKNLNIEETNDLLKMTPLSYHKTIEKIELEEVTISLKILVLKKQTT